MISENKTPEIEVILCTFNGEAFISMFLDSLKLQSGVTIHLRVSDDGSTDNTLEIIESYRTSFASLLIACGPQTGPCDNFLGALRSSAHEFTALADQDDIWCPNHLLDSINRIGIISNEPALSFSSVVEFSTDKKKTRTWPSDLSRRTIHNSIFENSCRGCTMVLNRKAVNLINLHRPKSAIMHDWWIYLLVNSCGKVVWTSNPEVHYRLHRLNFVGTKKPWAYRLALFLKSFRAKNWAPVQQLEEILQNYSEYMPTNRKILLLESLNALNSNFFTKVIWLKNLDGKLRLNKFENFAVMMKILTI